MSIIMRKLQCGRRSRRAASAVLLTTLVATMIAGIAAAATPAPYTNGFETNVSGWEPQITRVASGTNGVPSSTGGWHAETPLGGGAFTRWCGFSSEFPSGGYSTSIDIYLNPAVITANDTRFEWSSAVSTPSDPPAHRRDFVFSVGGYIDSDATGSGPRFVMSASNNASGDPRNPANEPFAITTAGWYTFAHAFRNTGNALAVEFTISSAGGAVLHSWTRSDLSDVIGSTVGGNRYGWFVTQQFPFLAFDNTRLQVSAPGPACTLGDLPTPTPVPTATSVTPAATPFTPTATPTTPSPTPTETPMPASTPSTPTPVASPWADPGIPLPPPCWAAPPSVPDVPGIIDRTWTPKERCDGIPEMQATLLGFALPTSTPTRTPTPMP